MALLAKILIGLVAFIHTYILWFEMFAWTSKGPKIFSTLPSELFPQTVSMAANQGLYNGFLAAGLIWTFFITDSKWQTNVATFFLLCVIIAGIYGALTVDKKILFVQTVPALIALLVLQFAK